MSPELKGCGEDEEDLVQIVKTVVPLWKKPRKRSIPDLQYRRRPRAPWTPAVGELTTHLKRCDAVVV
ncbi:unnamed protein product [Lota lota]